METVTKGFDARLANRPFLVFDFRAFYLALNLERQIEFPKVKNKLDMSQL